MSQNGDNNNGSNNFQDSSMNKAKITGNNIDVLIDNIGGGLTRKIDVLIAKMKKMHAQ